jgi:hypothetical protein
VELELHHVSALFPLYNDAVMRFLADPAPLVSCGSGSVGFLQIQLRWFCGSGSAGFNIQDAQNVKGSLSPLGKRKMTRPWLWLRHQSFVLLYIITRLCRKYEK